MSTLRRIFLAALISISILNADWREIKEIRLKKDATQQIVVRYDDVPRLLTFRWTLYTNGNLVVHRSFDDFVAQNVLSENYKNQSFRIQFTPRGKKYGAMSYVLIRFKEFDFEKNEAVFELLLRDDEKKTVLKYTKADR